MVFSVIQPSYFPGISVTGKLLAADKIIWADSFIFNRHSEINRTKIKAITGSKWLTVPVLSANQSGEKIQHILIDNHENWAKNHRRSIHLNYKNTAYYYYYCDGLEPIFHNEWNCLADILWASLEWITSALHRKTQIIKSSELPAIQDRSERVIKWAEKLNCDTYLIHDFEKNLIDLNRIVNAGINVLNYNLNRFDYFQQYDGFIYPLSILDILFNEGEDTSRLMKEHILLEQV
ncbi:WbqC family protein [candidate division KSB1 bacterium]|nr:WbqC family protein [candidate division KSB1 bacterium]